MSILEKLLGEKFKFVVKGITCLGVGVYFILSAVTGDEEDEEKIREILQRYLGTDDVYFDPDWEPVIPEEE